MLVRVHARSRRIDLRVFRCSGKKTERTAATVLPKSIATNIDSLNGERRAKGHILTSYNARRAAGQYF